jgi:SAM-dependent methyltransferase
MSLPKLIWKNLTFPFSAQAAEQRYDRQHGIDTAGYIEPSRLGIGEDAIRTSLQYDPTPPTIAQFLIQKIAPRAKGFTFVDIGSGKGRVVLIAARFPFQKVVGFEHSQMLNTIAAENIARFEQHESGLAPIELVTGDATKLPLPDGPLVLFLYNPFGLEAVRDFAASVRLSYLRAPRKIFCIYYNPAHREEFEPTGIFTLRQSVDCPRDPGNRYDFLRFQALILETGEP